MADPGHHTSATDNEAVVIAGMDGHMVPDRYAIGLDDGSLDYERSVKLGSSHPKRIHNDYERRYGQDSPLSEPC